MAPTVTAIVPTFNRPDLLGATIESALAQTYDDLVVLVGDNGGSPLNEGIVRGFDDPRVRYTRNTEGVGAQENWLGLIAQATTPLVASLHDDDTWQPDFLERTVPLMLEDPSIGITFTDFWCVDGSGELLAEHSEWLQRHAGRDRIPAGRFTGSYADGLRMVAVWGSVQPAYAAVLRRQAVLDTDFPDDIAPIYDLWLAYQLLRRGEGFAYVPERLTNYRVWGGSLTARGYGPGQDAVYRHIVAENQDAGPVLDEVERTWADERFGRGRALFDDPTQRLRSQIELTAAAPHLSGRRRVIARLAGTSALGWNLTRLVRSAVRAVRFRLRPDGVMSSGVPEAATKASHQTQGMSN